MRRLAATLAILGLTPCAAAMPDLLSVPVGGQIEIPGFAYAEGKSFGTDLHFERIDVYAPDARILVPLADGRYLELPRSERRFFVSDRSKTASRMYLSISADGRDFEGALFDAEGTHDFSGVVEAKGLRVLRSQAANADGQHFDCEAGGGHHGHDADPDTTESSGGHDRSKAASRRAVVAVDTDNELLALKFGDNPAAATDYLAAAFAGMNVFYERDLDVRLVQGATLLRVQSLGGPDPFSAEDVGSQLVEVGGVWRNTPSLQGVSRAFVMLLSGKSPNSDSSQGTAWVLSFGNYCTSTGTGGNNFGHYSVSQVVRSPAQGAATDVALLGHQLGHNFGAEHTHCSDRITGVGGRSSNTIDQCFNRQAGCYTGPVSCPEDNSIINQGSLMSYCTFRVLDGGAACPGNNGLLLTEFHPAHQNLLFNRIQANINNSCLGENNTDMGPTVSALAPASGSNTPLGGGAVGTPVSGSISFVVSGGGGSGTTLLQCTAIDGTVQVASGSPQTIAVGGTAGPVVARFTLTDTPQLGTVQCVATPSGGLPATFNYNFTAQAGFNACTGDCIFSNGFE